MNRRFRTTHPTVQQEGLEEYFTLAGTPGESVTLTLTPLLPLETVERVNADGSTYTTLQATTDYTIVGRTLTIVAGGTSGAEALRVVYRIVAFGTLDVPEQVSVVTNPDNVLDADRTISGSVPVEAILDQVSVDWSLGVNTSIVMDGSSGGGSIGSVGAHVLVQSAAGASTGKVTSIAKTQYFPGHDLQVDFTASWAGVDAGVRAISGWSDGTDGVYVGYDQTTAWTMYVKSGGAVVATVPLSAANGDKLDGSATSDFTRGGVPEAFDPTKENWFRVRLAWLGSAPYTLRILSPDKRWVTIHTFRWPNLQVAPSIQNPNLPMFIEATRVSGTGVVSIQSGSWRAGAYIGASQDRVSGQNSSVTPLGASATFTGRVESTLGYHAISVNVMSNAVGQLFFDASDDGVNFHANPETRQYTNVNNASRFVFTPTSQFYRMRYLNGGSVQTTFTIATIMRTQLTAAFSPLSAGITQDALAQMVLANIFGFDSNGSKFNVGTLLQTINAVQYPSLLTAVTKILDDIPLRSMGTPKVTNGGVATAGATTFISAANALPNRRGVTIKADPANTKVVYVRFESGEAQVAGPSDIPFSADDTMDFPWGPSVPIKAITTGAGQVLICIEAAD